MRASCGQYHAVAGGSSIKGCQIVAVGRKRSADHRTTTKMIFPPRKRVAENRGTLSRVRANCSLHSGGLRYAATTGYYLTAFQAVNVIVTFSSTRYRVVALTSCPFAWVTTKPLPSGG